MKQKHKTQKSPGSVKSGGQILPTSLQKWLALLIIFLILAIYFKPFFIDGLSPAGSDVVGGIGKMHQLHENEQRTKEKSLWNPYLFSGMPVYHRILSHHISIDTAIQLLSSSKGRNVFIYYLIGAVGMFLFLQFLQIPIWGAFIASLAFVLMPNYGVLVQAGHFQQFRPIMLMPWVVWGLMALLKKTNFWNLCFFIIALALQIRTKHYQIVFYTLFILAFIAIAHFIVQIRAKQFKVVLKQIVLIGIAFALAIGMSLQALWPVSEYTPFSIRGGTGEQNSTGLDYKYATDWSFAPKEMISLLIPNAFGGASAVKYKGSAVPELKGRMIPGYWGEMPFTEGGDYIGIITFLLAAVGIIAGIRNKNRLVITLGVFCLVALFLAFGRHLALLYNLFFNYLPFFNKFRVPVMILVAIYFCFAALAGLGLKYIMEVPPEKRKQLLQIVLGVSLFMLFIGLLPFLFKSLFSFVKTGEPQQYSAQIVRDARLDLFRHDAQRLLLFTFIAFTSLWIYLRGWINQYLLAFILFVLLLADLIPINNRFFKPMGSTAEIEQVQFAKTQTDDFLLKDKSLYRIFPLEQNVFNNNNWSYYHQCIGGYSPEKLRIYQDIIDHCIFAGADEQLPVNWNIIKMLNGKYIITPQPVTIANLELVNVDKASKYYTYKNLSALPRAFFVDRYEIISDRKKRLERLNDPGFDPAVEAILEKQPLEPVASTHSPDPEIVNFTPNRIELQVATDRNSLLVLSEIFYPRGWKATMDGASCEIYKTDHILRSVMVPEGRHQIKLEFQPDSFKWSSTVSGVLNVLVYGGLLGMWINALVRKYFTKKHA